MAWLESLIEVIGANKFLRTIQQITSAGTVQSEAVVLVDPENVDSVLRVGVIKSTLNSTTAPLGAGATYTGTIEPISSYQQINLTLFGRPNVAVSGDGSDAKGSLFFEFSPDGTNIDISVPIIVRTLGVFIPYPLINVGTHYRVRYVNDGGAAAIAILGTGETAGTPTAQTVFRLNSFLLPQATKELARTIDQAVSGSDPVTLGRVVVMGKTTDGTYLNVRTDGVDSGNSSTANLGSGGTFTGAWFDAKGYASYALLVNSNAASSASGVVMQFSADASTVRATDTYTYDGGSNGIRFSGPIKARYIRVVYTNSGTAQTGFFLENNLSVVPAQVPISTVSSSFSDSNNVVTGKNVITAKGRTSGTYANILSGDNAGLEVDVRALTGVTQMDQVGVTGTAGQFASTPLANRRTITFGAPTSNTKIIAIGKSNTITVTSGSVPLGPGASITFDIDDTDNTWWAIAESGTQRLFWTEVS